jgi:WD40 repeat protein
VSFGTIVTGDSVGNVLVWDLRTLRYLRQLWHASAKKKVDLKVSSPEPVISVSLNHKTGDILTLVGSTLTIFDINGNLVAKQSSEDVISFSSGKNTVPSCAISTDCTEWMDKGIIAVTGHKNGDIRFWGVNRDEELLIMRHLLMDKVHSCPITCLCIEGKRQDQLLAGDKSGKMSISQTIRLGWLAQNDLTRIAEEILKA